MNPLVIVLDAGPLSAILYAKRGSAIETWYNDHLAAGTKFVIPEVADYEVRRLLVKRKAVARIARLDELIKTVYYHPISTSVMHHAADAWAACRLRGQPFTVDDRFDGDAVFVGHVRVLEAAGTQVLVATHDVADLSPWVDAYEWQDIEP